jgi:hypothetical protein
LEQGLLQQALYSLLLLVLLLLLHVSLFLQEHGRFEDEDFYEEFAKPPADRNIPAIEFMREEAVKVWEEFGQLPDRCHY